MGSVGGLFVGLRRGVRIGRGCESVFVLARL